MDGERTEKEASQLEGATEGMEADGSLLWEEDESSLV